MRFTVYRLHDTSENVVPRFLNSESLQRMGYWPVKPEAYEGILQASNDGLDPLEVNEALDSIYCIFNACSSDCSHSHYAMSVGDIIVLDGEHAGAYFCESVGWLELPDFYKAVHME